MTHDASVSVRHHTVAYSEEYSCTYELCLLLSFLDPKRCGITSVCMRKVEGVMTVPVLGLTLSVLRF